jgi:hypothetical protein
MAAKSQTLLPLNYLNKNYTDGKVKYNALVTANPGNRKFQHKLFSTTPAPEIDTNKVFYILPTCLSYSSLFINDTTKFVQTNSVTYSDSLNNIAVYSEIAADYLGPVRVSVGITLSYPKNASDSSTQTTLTEQKFVQRLGSGSGAVNFCFNLPLYYFHTKIFT